MEETKLIELIAKILVVDSASISLSSNLESLGWDSLSNLSFISEIDEMFGMQISAEKLGKAEKVDDLIKLLNQ